MWPVKNVIFQDVSRKNSPPRMCFKKSYTPQDVSRKIHVPGCVQKKITLDSCKICPENLCSSRTWLEEKMFNSPRMWLERSCTPPGSRKKLHYPGICPDESYTPPGCGKKKITFTRMCFSSKNLYFPRVWQEKFHSPRVWIEKSYTPPGCDQKKVTLPQDMTRNSFTHPGFGFKHLHTHTHT